MAAHKGNEFWKLRTKHGREKLFTDPKAFKEACYEYFESVHGDPLYSVEQRRATTGREIPQGATNEERAELLDPLIKIPKPRAFTLRGLCIYMGLNTRYFNDLEAQIAQELLQPNKMTLEVAKEYSEILLHIREIIFQRKYDLAAGGFLNPVIMSRDRDLELVDSKEHSGKNGAPLLPVPSINVTTVTSIHAIAEDDEDEDEEPENQG